MLLSLQQKYIMEVLNKLGCLRRDQIYLLTRDYFQTEDFTITEKRMDTMLRQLPVITSNVRVDKDYVRFITCEPEPLRLEAIDVMLELSNGYPIDFSAIRNSKALLGFALGGEPPKRFTVARYTAGDLSIDVPGSVVWISPSDIMPGGLVMPENHYYALRRKDGSHRFFG